MPQIKDLYAMTQSVDSKTNDLEEPGNDGTTASQQQAINGTRTSRQHAIKHRKSMIFTAMWLI